MTGMPIQMIHPVKGLDPVADAFAATVTSDVVNMENWHYVRFLIYNGVGATGTSTITVEACDDVTPSNTTAIAFHYRQCTSGDTPGTLTAATTAGFDTTASSSKIVEVFVAAQALASTGYGYVRLKAVEVVDSPVLGCILIDMIGPRHAVEPHDTVIT